MSTEVPKRLSELKPGSYVMQPPKKVVETKWTEAGICITYDDGSTFSGAASDGVTTLVPASEEQPPSGGEA